MGFNYLFIFPPGYVALCGSKARHRLGSESVSWCLETSLFFKTHFPGWSSVPTSFVSLFIFYIFSYLLLKTVGCFSGCLMSSAGIQKLFCGIFSVFKCSFDEFVGEKVVSPSYFSTSLGPPFLNGFFKTLQLNIKYLLVLTLFSFLQNILSVTKIKRWRRKWQPTPVFLPGESHGRRSLVGCSPWGRTESDTTEATWQQQGKKKVKW